MRSGQNERRRQEDPRWDEADEADEADQSGDRMDDQWQQQQPHNNGHSRSKDSDTSGHSSALRSQRTRLKNDQRERWQETAKDVAREAGVLDDERIQTDLRNSIAQIVDGGGGSGGTASSSLSDTSSRSSRSSKSRSSRRSTSKKAKSTNKKRKKKKSQR